MNSSPTEQTVLHCHVVLKVDSALHCPTGDRQALHQPKFFFSFFFFKMLWFGVLYSAVEREWGVRPAVKENEIKTPGMAVTRNAASIHVAPALTTTRSFAPKNFCFKRSNVEKTL